MEKKKDNDSFAQDELIEEDANIIDYFIDENYRAFRVSPSGELIPTDKILRDGEVIEKAFAEASETYAQDAKDAATQENGEPGKFIYAYNRQKQILLLSAKGEMKTVEQIKEDTEEIKRQIEVMKRIADNFLKAQGEMENLFFADGGGCLKVAKGFLVSYRSYKFGDKIKRPNDNPLTREDLAQDIQSLTEGDDIEDMLATVGLLDMNRGREEMIWLPSQDLEDKGVKPKKHQHEPITIYALSDAYEAAKDGKKSETRFRSVSKESYELSCKVVSLVDSCIREMECSQDSLERRCAQALKLEFIDYETMDKVVTESVMDETGKEQQRKKTISITYEEKGKMLGVSRRTFITHKNKGIEFFAKRCFNKMMAQQEDYEHALNIILSKREIKVVDNVNKNKNRGAEPQAMKAGEITFLDD